MILNDLAPAVEEPIGRFLTEFCERMAQEGIPVAVIARTVQRPIEKVYLCLHQAKQIGRIAELPRPDWPPSSRFNERAPALASFKSFDNDLLMLLMQHFDLSRQRASVLLALLRRISCTREQLNKVLKETSRDAVKDTNPKMLDVVMHHVRGRLKQRDLYINTIRDGGYSLSDHVRSSIYDIIGIKP
jgi:predicted Rossmann fold nucleotide-binding protein DprA/Smf involved in DNA uptake